MYCSIVFSVKQGLEMYLWRYPTIYGASKPRQHINTVYERRIT